MQKRMYQKKKQTVEKFIKRFGKVEHSFILNSQVLIKMLYYQTNIIITTISELSQNKYIVIEII
ncbi:MAG: hypothetical protein K0R16_1717 [Nitrososphaeraceae archaeon]|nr:hypothetical protein [Nitrososphaeraceae archaeon]